MLKRLIIAVVLVFILWSALDFLIHGVILQPAYQATAHLWRPMPEMKIGLMRAVTLICAVCFVGIYAWLVNPKSVIHGIRFGLILGVMSGLSMGYGSYSVMPIPYAMALTWFLGTLVQMVLAGWLTGYIVKNA